MKYRYILLDWDGNLAKTLDMWLTATRIPLDNRGIKVSDKIISTQCFGRPAEGYMELGVKDVYRAVDEMNILAKSMLPEVELYPDALFVLEELKNAGRKTALITTSPRANVAHLLDKYNLHHFFDVVIAQEDTKRHKPDPEPLERALRLLGGNKQEAVMIGDSDKDIDAGNNAKVDSILFYPEAHEKFYNLAALKCLNPTYIVRDFREIIDII